MAKIKIPETVLDDDHADFDATISKQADKARRISDIEHSYDGVYSYYTITNSKLPFNLAQYIVSKGGDVLEWPLFIEISDKGDVVPSVLPNSTYLDDDEVEQSHTWNTWIKSTSTFYEADGRTFIGTNANDGTDLDFSNLITLVDDLVFPQNLPAQEEE